MFDKIFEFIFNVLDLFFVWKIVDEYEAGVVLRFGRYHRTVGPGRHWKWPLGIDNVLVDNVVPNTNVIPEQVLTTKDDKKVVISAMVRWRIHDIRKILLEVEDAENVMADCAMGEIAQHVKHCTLQQLHDEDTSEPLYRAVRRRGWAWGIEIQELQITNFAETKVLRLIQ